MARRKRRPLTPPEQKRIVELLEAGTATNEVAKLAGVSRTSVWRAHRQWHLRRRWQGTGKLRLDFNERESISRGLAAGESMRQIARELGRAPSTISREINRCGGPDRYRAFESHQRAIRDRRRPKCGKLTRNPRLRAEIESRLLLRHSPEQISAALKAVNPDDVSMQAAPETIYRSLYVQAKGELKSRLTENLRSKRTRRRPRGSKRGGARIVGMVPIAERPPEVDDRRVPGHWEGDLLVGRKNQSFVATLVERQTRFVMLARLGEDSTSERLVDALKERIAELPKHLILSLTWDQGREMAGHARFSSETGVDVYFCDPHSPWQRGTNENTNRLLRDYLPKGTDLSLKSQRELDLIAAELNARPRKTLGWSTPAEKMGELLR